MPWFNIPFIVFDKQSLSFGSYKEKKSIKEVEKPHSGTHDDINLARKHPKQKLTRAWFRIKSYYTAPVNKFLFNLVNYLLSIVGLRGIKVFEFVIFQTCYPWGETLELEALQRPSDTAS